MCFRGRLESTNMSENLNKNFICMQNTLIGVILHKKYDKNEKKIIKLS